MISTDQRRLSILAWLKDKGPTEFNNHTKKQSFLYVYEVLAKINEYTYSIYFLTSYKNNIIFQDVLKTVNKNKDYCITFSLHSLVNVV